MCNFLSAVLVRDGDLLLDPEHTDSHEDLIEIHRLRDDGRGRFVRVEFVPDKEAPGDLSRWALNIDEPSTPDWIDLAALRERLVEIVRPHLVTDERGLLIGGWWILLGGAKIRKADNARIAAMTGDSFLESASGSTRIDGVRDSATVSSVWGSAAVSDVRDSATVRGVRGSATVRGVRDSATVSSVRGSATVSDVWDSATVSGVWGSARVVDDHRDAKKAATK